MSDAPHAPSAPQLWNSEFDDPSIPVLTDRIYLPALDLDISVAAQPPAQPLVEAPPIVPAPVPPSSTKTEETTEVIGTVEVPVLARVAKTPAAGPGDVMATAATVAADRPGETDVDIETELDRDLLAELNADLDAMLAAEAVAAAAGDDGAMAKQTQPASAGTEVPAEPGPLSASTDLVPPAAGSIDAAAQHSGTAAVPSTDTGEHDGAAVAIGGTEQTGGEAPARLEEADVLRAAVLEAVARRLPTHIDTTVRDLMRPAIDEAITRLGEEAQVALRISLQQLIEQVLNEELARRQQSGIDHN